MKDKLTSGATARSKTETINDIVKTHLELLKEELARDAFLAESLMEEAAELKFAHAVLTAKRLLLTKLAAVFGHLLGATSNVHSGNTGALLDRALGHIATSTLEKELLPFTTALTTNWTCITTHD
jgi:hypothetical protein